MSDQRLTAESIISRSADGPVADMRKADGENAPKTAQRSGALVNAAFSGGPDRDPGGLTPENVAPYIPLALPPSFSRMPVALNVAVPVREFRVRDLLRLLPGAVIETQWQGGEDLPVVSGDLQLAWSEFEVIESRLAVRITRLA